MKSNYNNLKRNRLNKLHQWWEQAKLIMWNVNIVKGVLKKVIFCENKLILKDIAESHIPKCKNTIARPKPPRSGKK